MLIKDIGEVIPQKNIVVFSPHFDDFHFMMGGYLLELKEQKLLHTKNFHINVIFSRSNYLARTGEGNFDTSLDRVKLASGKRLLEDMNCIDELLGEFNYRYELHGEKECFVRAKPFADGEMEFPHGMYEDFDKNDEEIFARVKERIIRWTGHEDTALVFPAAIKEHIDHFITREAGIEVAKSLGWKSKAAFCFFEDKPYGGIASTEEINRLESFIADNGLDVKVFKHHPQTILDLAFKHYVSQVEEVYKVGVLERSNVLRNKYKADFECDRMFVYNC